MKKHNFSAGPSILDESVIRDAASAVLNYNGTGLSILEVSHRSKEFSATMREARELMKELLDIPEGYEVLFLGGGASLQFAQVPMNLLKTKAAYIDSGTWANKAIKEAKLFGQVDVLGSSKEDLYSWYPKPWDKVTADYDYLHITTNNTVYGTEIREDIDVPCRLVGDMSSDIFTRSVDVSKYDLIYGGAQKNIAPAGVTFVIVKTSALDQVDRVIPTMLKYSSHLEESMYNTPPVFPVYVALQTMKWYKELGGVKELERMNLEKAQMLYDEIDRNKLFRGTVRPEDRSIMNVCFVMNDEYKELEKEYLEYATAQGMSSIKGHRSIGGFRASLYNALPKTSVEALIQTMRDFERKH